MATGFIRVSTQQFRTEYPLTRPVVIATPVNADVEMTINEEGDTEVTVSAGSGGEGGATLLSELDDVELTSLTDGDTLVYSTTENKWINEQPSGSTSADTYSFLVNFTGTDPSSISGAPSGWTITIPSTGVIQMVHNKQSQPRACNIWGKASGSPETWVNRIVGLTAINMSYLFSTRLTTTLLNNVSTNTAAAQGGQARIELEF